MSRNALSIRHPAAAIRSNDPIPLEVLRSRIPSAFAEEAHESRSARYTFIPTAEVIEGLGREGFFPFAAMQQRTRDESKRDYTRHLIRFRHPGLVARQVGDVIPEVVLLNSHDGTSSYRLMAGLFRLVCTNGLVVSESTCADVSVRHSGNVVHEVIEGAFQVLDGTKNAIETSQAFRAIDLQPAEQDAFGEAAAELRWGDEAPVEGRAVVQARRWGDSDNSLWTTFNRAQENIIRGGVRGRNANGGRMTTREVSGVSENVRLNRALWLLTERMAELKGADIKRAA